MHRDQHSSIQMDGLEDDTIAAGDAHQFDPNFEQLWLPSTWSARFSSAWPKLRSETAQPAVAAARRGDGVPAMPSNGVFASPTR